ncbi:GNAT family N-acetyltransferase [Isoptericola chiayiensis]|uniref:GNAT family N-acetyltransferase n=1 Tax=Isoptericola chiayiensis TaxID=579446 RepID=A0ABP8YDJ9_9MICO|nr:GNAT family N-acetyltransferase [Isoptericola chiayiensis]NOV99981.1 ribosomal protein S18 acetylase RimI-like enzyme [Isoptericola chiayiensis]
MNPPQVRAPVLDDVPAIARLHVRCWQQTYRGLMPDAVLDDPGLVDAREKQWRRGLDDPAPHTRRAAVAVIDHDIVGLAMSGPPLDDDATWSRQLFNLYVDAAHHGSGAGHDLLQAVIEPGESAALWVADPNPRAQAFYRKHGFTPDGTTTVQDGVTELRMVHTPTG